MVAIGVSGVADVTANAKSNAELRADLRAAIQSEIIETELAGDAIMERLQNEDLPREEERALLKERRILLAQERRLKMRRTQTQRWNKYQLRWFARIFVATPVSVS